MVKALSEIFDEKPQSQQPVEAEAEPEAAAEATAEPEPVEAAPEAPAPVESDPVEATADEPPRVPVEALQEERAKRQEYEQRIELLEQQLHNLSAGPQQEKEPDAPLVPDDMDFFEDPKGSLERVVSTVEGRLTAQFQQQLKEERINHQVQLARVKYPDFDDKVKAFERAAQKDPTLLAQAQAHPDPAEYVYQHAQRISELEPYGGSVAKMREALEKQIRDEIAAEAAKEKRKSVPQPVTNGAAGGRAENRKAGPPSLNEIFSGR